MKLFSKILILILTLSFVVTTQVFATPLSPDQKSKLVNQPALREEMGKMIISIADLDILVNRDKVSDYEIFKEDAERILKSIKQIESLDKDGIYKDFLSKLKEPSEKLLEYSILKNKKAMDYPQKIFDACFACHKANRGY